MPAVGHVFRKLYCGITDIHDDDRKFQIVNGLDFLRLNTEIGKIMSPISKHSFLSAAAISFLILALSSVEVSASLGTPVTEWMHAPEIVTMPGYSGQAIPSKSLPAGSWWTVIGTYQNDVAGTGSYNGSIREDGTYTDKYTVVSSDGTTMVISFSDAGSSTCTATDTWVSLCQTNSGAFSSQTSYTIDVATLKVTVTSGNKDLVGRPAAMLLATNAALKVGDTAWQYWYVPNSDATGDTITDVLFKVDKLQTINVKGVDVTVRDLTYTGQHLGLFWANSTGKGVFEEGSKTLSELYDTTYGIYMGETVSGNYAYSDSQGSWTDKTRVTEQISDTNLVWPISITIGSPTVNLPVTVDGTSYAGDQLPMVFTWDVGSTHTLRVDAITGGGSGVRYVFTQWSDGSKDASRSITATESTNLTATFKTQYLLNITSDLGNPQGSGWYDAGSTATFSVTTPQPETGLFSSLGGKTVFQAWTGDSTANTATATIVMDAPKTVQAQWTTDNSEPYMILGGLCAAVVVVIILAFLMMRRRVPAYIPAPPPPPPGASQPPLCVTCGRPTTYIQQYQRYYCYNCRKYS